MAHPVAYPMAYPKNCNFTNCKEKKASYASKVEGWYSWSQVFLAKIRIICINTSHEMQLQM